MATLRQIEANRRNSQKSTGPRSVEGKAASRFNALKSGINAQSEVIPGEDAAELEALALEYNQQFQPATPVARFLVDALVAADWQLRRLRKVEAQLWLHGIDEKQRSFSGLDKDNPMGHIFAWSREDFVRLQRRIDSAERSYYRALKELQRIQPEPPVPPPPEPNPDPLPAISPQIGFVPQDPQMQSEADLRPVPEAQKVGRTPWSAGRPPGRPDAGPLPSGLACYAVTSR